MTLKRDLTKAYKTLNYIKFLPNAVNNSYNLIKEFVKSNITDSRNTYWVTFDNGTIVEHPYQLFARVKYINDILTLIQVGYYKNTQKEEVNMRAFVNIDDF